MAVKTIHVSDISGKEADEPSLGGLVVYEHPEYSDLPVTLEARFVTVERIAMGDDLGEAEAAKGDRRSGQDVGDGFSSLPRARQAVAPRPRDHRAS
jgi:hypothetical protein